jgi:serine/threonine protein phosphatase PrpC
MADGAQVDLPEGGKASPELMGEGERAVDALLGESHLTPPHGLAALLTRHVNSLGVTDTVAYVADLQQDLLVPFLGPEGAPVGHSVEPLHVDATLAGRAFQHVQVQTQDLPEGGVRVWIPMLDGVERLGVLAVTAPSAAALTEHGGLLDIRLRRFATLAAELVMTKTLYGDTLVNLRRQADMGLAAEIQWSLLPPLTFASHDVTVAAALEPAYQVAGDTIDYAVDAGRAHVAVFDGMGHGLQAAQLAVLAVSAYRNARRGGRSLADTTAVIDTALASSFGGEAFTTAVLARLDTDDGTLTWVNAGHPPPLLLRDGKVVKQLVVSPHLPLGLGGNDPEATGPAIGTEHLQPGDRVLLYTDGVVEARSPDGEFFGTDRLADLVIRNLAGGMPAPETMRRVVRELLAHQQGQLSDDASLLLLEWRTRNEGALLF